MWCAAVLIRSKCVMRRSASQRSPYVASIWLEDRMVVSGVRNSWEVAETKRVFSSFNCCSRWRSRSSARLARSSSPVASRKARASARTRAITSRRPSTTAAAIRPVSQRDPDLCAAQGRAIRLLVAGGRPSGLARDRQREQVGDESVDSHVVLGDHARRAARRARPRPERQRRERARARARAARLTAVRRRPRRERRRGGRARRRPPPAAPSAARSPVCRRACHAARRATPDSTAASCEGSRCRS